MRPQDHANATEEVLGEPFLRVHHFLDRNAPQLRPDGTRYFDRYHRRTTHHLQGVEEVRALWGDVAALAAKLHIYQDLMYARDGRQQILDQLFEIPANQQDFVRKGWV